MNKGSLQDFLGYAHNAKTIKLEACGFDEAFQVEANPPSEIVCRLIGEYFDKTFEHQEGNPEFLFFKIPTGRIKVMVLSFMFMYMVLVRKEGEPA